MPSKFDTKFEAALDKVAQSAKARPWKRPLFWVAAAAFVLFSILKETLEGFFEATENISFPNDPPVEDEKTQAEVDPDGWKDMVMIHQHYEMNDFGTIQGLKDPEW